MPLIIIDPAGDLKITIVEKESITYDEHGKECKEPRDVYSMKVNRKILMANTSYFTGMFKEGFAEAEEHEVKLLEDEGIESMELWMRALHGNLIPNDKLDLTIPEAWDVVSAGRKYLFTNDPDKPTEPLDLVKSWFKSWFEHQQTIYTKAKSPDQQAMLEGLAFLCWTFDDALGFAWVTKHLVYNSSGVINLEGDNELFVPERVLRQIYAARATMANKIDRMIFNPVYEFPRSSCECAVRASFAYIRALMAADSFKLHRIRYIGHPIGGHMETQSVLQQISGLRKFKYTPPNDVCDSCKLERGNRTFNQSIEDLAGQMEKYFNGICTKCLAQSINEKDAGDKYWGKDLPGHHGSECQLHPHGQPSWYFSYGGKPDSRTANEQAYKDRQVIIPERERLEKKKTERQKFNEARNQARKDAKWAAVKLEEKLAAKAKAEVEELEASLVPETLVLRRKSF